jgi:hypothetical protein
MRNFPNALYVYNTRGLFDFVASREQHSSFHHTSDIEKDLVDISHGKTTRQKAKETWLPLVVQFVTREVKDLANHQQLVRDYFKKGPSKAMVQETNNETDETDHFESNFAALDMTAMATEEVKTRLQMLQRCERNDCLGSLTNKCNSTAVKAERDVGAHKLSFGGRAGDISDAKQQELLTFLHELTVEGFAQLGCSEFLADPWYGRCYEKITGEQPSACKSKWHPTPC